MYVFEILTHEFNINENKIKEIAPRADDKSLYKQTYINLDLDKL